jgi:thiol-disulfide isomerase/thioredoxin
MRTNRLLIGTISLFLTAANTFAQPDKYVVIEEKTGTWCGYCPSGAVAMHNLEESEDKFIGIAIHNGDPMANSYYDSQSTSLPDFSGYPYAAADRVVGAHAASSQSSFNARKSETPSASVSVEGTVEAGMMTIKVTVEFFQAVSGDWRIAAVVTENHVTGSGSGYDQSNYYSGDAPGSLEGAGLDWTVEENPVPAEKMIYDHVARLIADDQYGGVEGSLPLECANGSIHDYTFVVPIDPSWSPANLNVIGMLIEPSGAINNAGKSNAQGVASTLDIEKNNFKLSAYPNPSSDLINLKLELDESANVTIEVVDILGAVVSVIETQNLSAGTALNIIDVSNLSEGVYFIKTTVNSKIELKRIVVSK